jgi:hypothetical protein
VSVRRASAAPVERALGLIKLLIELVPGRVLSWAAVPVPGALALRQWVVGHADLLFVPTILPTP